jgi:hypothetical protein
MYEQPLGDRSPVMIRPLLVVLVFVAAAGLSYLLVLLGAEPAASAILHHFHSHPKRAVLDPPLIRDLAGATAFAVLVFCGTEAARSRARR